MLDMGRGRHGQNSNRRRSPDWGAGEPVSVGRRILLDRWPLIRATRSFCLGVTAMSRGDLLVSCQASSYGVQRFLRITIRSRQRGTVVGSRRQQSRLRIKACTGSNSHDTYPGPEHFSDGTAPRRSPSPEITSPRSAGLKGRSDATRTPGGGSSTKRSTRGMVEPKLRGASACGRRGGTLRGDRVTTTHRYMPGFG